MEVISHPERAPHFGFYSTLRPLRAISWWYGPVRLASFIEPKPKKGAFIGSYSDEHTGKLKENHVFEKCE